MSSRLVIRRIYSSGYRNIVRLFPITRWNWQFFVCQQNLIRSMFLMRTYLVFVFNDSSLNFLDFNLENLVFKFLFIFLNFFSHLYVPFINDSRLFFSNNSLPLRKPFLLLSNLPLIGI